LSCRPEDNIQSTLFSAFGHPIVLGSESQERIITNVLLVSGACGSRTRVRGYFCNPPYSTRATSCAYLHLPLLAATWCWVWSEFGNRLGKAKRTARLSETQKYERGVLKSYTPLTGGHDDVTQNKKYMKIKLTCGVVPSTESSSSIIILRTSSTVVSMKKYNAA
jgi:hypothetical protein